MTKEELIANIAEEAQIKKVDAEKIINSWISIVSEGLKTKGRLALAGFGTFMVTDRDARVARNPQTGLPIKISATRKVIFKPYRQLNGVTSPITSIQAGNKPLRIFICHASADKPIIRMLHNCLRQADIEPWFDEVDLIAGQDWELEIPKAIRASDAIIVCLSRHSVTKAGYVQREIKYALDVADEQPEGAIFIIPVRLDECDVPERLKRWQWVDLFRPEGYKKLARALKVRAYAVGRAWEQRAEETIASSILPLPRDVSIVPPSNDCPVHVREFSGKWFGIWDDILDHLLVVEEINPPNAIAIYSVGIAEQWGYTVAKWNRVRGTIEPGRLVLSLPRPAVVTYSLQNDGTLGATYEHSGRISRARMVRL